ncbi:histidinol-phosphatase (PHP family) [Virgibacillus natechei]|uniref:Histidinol-phosphatase n=1 Tax=Virgibacillus natechei TaxID=1216297 RepID=A0ABS4IHT6_9BACI|nr:histidinol-phosphatase HisJ family protein [Virgibacillus natechei]MBP1970485.1 histidinol-phosphatase (PHP family) [Virgibacillus natechei]UZD14109.1 histidinol-phosphatase HisJ family protein [Virgibacillus natechei]
MYLTEYHHHTDNSFDSKASMNGVCDQAILKGIDEICFTEHFSVNPRVPTYGHMDFDRYFSQINACREKYKGSLTIKAGIELCEPNLLTKEYEQALEDLDLDFILGSVHNINEEKLRKYMTGKEIHDVYQGYFEELYELVSKADIDIIAHFDLMKRYAMDPLGNYNFVDFQEIIELILQKAIERGIGLEINTSGLSNVKVNEAFPKMDILKHYRSLGGEILTIGSDSHRAETVGSMLEDALSMAKEAGFQYVYTFERRVAKAIKIEGL